jgi:hypothetical protein
MSKRVRFARHPECEQLLGLMDRDASEISAETRRHVEQCWKCQSHVEEMQTAIGEFARHHERVVVPAVPPAPRPWMDLRLAMRQWDQANPQVSVGNPIGWRRLAFPKALLPGAGSTGRVIAGGALVACLAVAFVSAIHMEPPRAKSPVKPPLVSKTTVSAAPLPTAIPESKNTTPSASVIRVPATAPVVSAKSFANEEVRVFEALHKFGADLGDPVEVSSNADGKIHVEGIGLAGPREVAIRNALSALPDVSFHTESAAPAVNDSVDARVMKFEVSRSSFETQLLRVAGGAAGLARLANHVLDESDAVLVRAHALRTLTDHFPPARLSQLGDAELASLEEMIASHRDGYSQHASELLSFLAPVRKALGLPTAGIRSMQGDRLDAARRMDRILGIIFGVAHSSLTTQEQLVEFAAACEGLSAKAGDRE